MSNLTPAFSVGVIFDLDGTLIDTLDDIRASVNDLLALYGRPPLSRERVRAIIGEGVGRMLELASELQGPEAVARLIDEYRPFYRAHMLERSRPYPEVPALLDTLASRCIPMSVLSNKSHEYTAPICDNLLPDHRFRFVIGATNEAPKKPDPTVALDLATRMGCRPDQLLFVGDSAVDVRTAANAGMTSVAVTWGFGDPDELAEAAPHHVIDSPMQLIDLVQAHTA